MNEHDFKEESFHLIKEIGSSPHATQRTLSDKLGISLGKTNYLLRELIRKGLIKTKNFYDNPGKLRKIKYTLTKEGMEHRLNLAYHFLKRKETEYNRIKEEWESLSSSLDNNHKNV